MLNSAQQFTLGGVNMQQHKRGRIISTVLSDMTAHAFETAGKDEFYPIAHLPLGYGSKGCKDTEAEYYATISTFANIARDEGSQVFILGFAPRSISAAWIKAAELIMQGSDVKIVLIPFAKVTEEWRGHVTVVSGNLLQLGETGIVAADNFGELPTKEFWQRVISVAKEVNKTFLMAAWRRHFMKIRVIAVPPGFAPEEVREQWLNLELPLATEAELAADPPSGRIGNQNGDGHVILREKAIEALVANGKQTAADFWQSLPLGRYLVFAKQCCELIPSESC